MCRNNQKNPVNSSLPVCYENLAKRFTNRILGQQINLCSHIGLYFNMPVNRIHFFLQKDKSLILYLNPPLSSSKSLAKCSLVIPAVKSFMKRSAQIHPFCVETCKAHKKEKGGEPRMTTKEKVICEMSWLRGLCNVKQFAWLLPIDSALQLKPQRAARRQRWVAPRPAAAGPEKRE